MRVRLNAVRGINGCGVLGTISALAIPALWACSVFAQAYDLQRICEPALGESRDTIEIPVLLPATLPGKWDLPNIKCTSDDAAPNRYRLSLYHQAPGNPAFFVASFAGSIGKISSIEELPNVHRVKLARGMVGFFRPVSCGGSCAPANLWWEQNGIVYQVQIELDSTTKEADQQRTLVETVTAMQAATPANR